MHETSGRTVAFRVAYVGARLHGLQLQPDQPTVQGAVEAALAGVLGTPVRVRFAGRTDAGVHATAQVVAFEVPTRIPLPALRHLANARLEPDVALGTGWEAEPGFHPRFRAVSRTYTYLLDPAARRPDPFRATLVAFPGVTLDRARLGGATARLLGTHDFTAFCSKPAAEERPVRSLDRLEVTPDRDLWRVTVQGRSFLRGMVRHLVGALIRVASGEREPAYLDELLALGASGRKDDTLVPAEARGLYLTGVEFPDGQPGSRVFPVDRVETLIPWLDLAAAPGSY